MFNKLYVQTTIHIPMKGKNTIHTTMKGKTYDTHNHERQNTIHTTMKEKNTIHTTMKEEIRYKQP